MPFIFPPSVRLAGTALAVILGAATLQSCSIDEVATPPSDIIGFAPQPAPVLMPEPQAPATYPMAEPVAAAEIATDVAAAPTMLAEEPADLGGGGPYLVAPEPVTVAAAEPRGMLVEMPEGDVSGPVVGGIGTDNPQEIAPQDIASQEIGASPGDPGIDAAQTAALGLSDDPPEPYLIAPEEQTQPQPQPKPKPQYAYMPRLSNPATAPEWAGGMPAAERTCRQQLKRLGVTFRDLPPIGTGTACSIPYPVEMTALSGGIKIKPAAKLNCQITAAFAGWVKNELAPSARSRYLSGIASINQLSSYSCRTMNSRRGAPMSEHARGNAIDVGKITLNSGKVIAVREPGFFAFREKSLLKNVRADSCKYFTTVLGPGSDVYHKDHFHFDLRKRRAGYRHCD